MTKQTEAMKLALELRALADRFSEGWHEGIKIDASDIVLLSDAAEALAEQPAQVDPCPGCLKGRVCRTPKCGRLKLPADHPLRSEQPAQQEPVAWADECRISLVTAIHFLASDYENALGVFRDDTEARRKAEGDIAYARKIAAKWNWNGTSPPAQRTWVGLTDDEILYCVELENPKAIAEEVEAKLREKNQ